MKDKRSGGWWPASVPSAAAAARRVSWWSRPAPPPPPPPHRPASLVIVHCGPSSSGPASPSSPAASVQRPSCSPPPPPPPRSPAASSYATAEEEEDSGRLELPQSPEGELLQGILAMIENTTGIASHAEPQQDEENERNEYVKTPDHGMENVQETEAQSSYEGQSPAVNDGKQTIECKESEGGCVQGAPCELAPSEQCVSCTPRNTPVPVEPPVLNIEYDRLPQDFIFQIPRLSASNSNSTDPQSSIKMEMIENKAYIPNSVPGHTIPDQFMVNKLPETPVLQDSSDNCHFKVEIFSDESATRPAASSPEGAVAETAQIDADGLIGTPLIETEIKTVDTEIIAPLNDQVTCKTAVNLPAATQEEVAGDNTEVKAKASSHKIKVEGAEEDGEESSGAGPRDTSSSPDNDHDPDGDMTLDDATDITLDDSTGSPVPPIPQDCEVNKTTIGEDEYFELARSGHYENVEYRRRPGGMLISRRRLQALHPPRLGAVKSGLSRAWLAMRDWGNEGARKLNEWARESSVPQDDQVDATSPPPVPPHPTVESTQLEQHAETSPPPLLPRSSPRVVRRRSMLVQAARRSRYQPLEGQSGFDELRRYMKQGGDFCKELSTILQERAEAEAQYAKSLAKLSAKLSRSAKEAVGSVSAAWQHAALQMEAEGEAHRDSSAALAERVVRPLRATLEAQHRVRKSVETAVDKTGKGLAEWRGAEAKAKKHSFACARENERLQDALQEAQRLGRAGRTGALSDKELSKLESKRRKAEESVKKADVEYYTFCIRAERARLEWESAVGRGSTCFQALEEQRLQHLNELAHSYLQLLAQLGPRIVQSAERLAEPVQACDVAGDLHTVASLKGVGQPIPEQLLPDFYPEHVTLAMNRERRRVALAKLLQLIRQDLERERRAKQGVEKLARALHHTPTFGTEDSQQDVSDKLHHMRSMLTYLEAARYKVHGTLAELEGQPRASHPLAPHIQVTRDRQGLQQSVLKVPPWVREESLEQLGAEAADWPDRGAADGNSVQPDSDFDEFSSQASDEKEFAGVLPPLGECEGSEEPMLGHCRALYDYTANLCDELNLRTGDVIAVREKQDDGWWLGELHGVVGIFPATYVEVLEKT